MKKYLLLLFFCFSFSFHFQAQTEEEVKRVIVKFFDGFHKQDSAVMNSVVHHDVAMHSVSVLENGNTKFSSVDFKQFVKSIVGIPDNTKFEEKIQDYFIVVDGAIANVRTPYTFYLNDKLYHCGMNNFQLVKIEEEWKIVYLVDTRKKDNCL